MNARPDSARDRPLERKVAYLSRPGAFPERPTRVDVVETHRSWVFLTDAHAYKLKKAVRYNAVDFRPLAARHAACLEELRLNRRLSEGVYLGAVPLTDEPGGALALDGTGPVVDWLIKMRRLPADRMLDALIARHALDLADLRRAATVLARFYQRGPSVAIGADAYRGQFARDIAINLRDLSQPEYGLPGSAIVATCAAQQEFLEVEAAVLDRRVLAGHIRDGHGDLRPQHVCLEPTPVIYDCLEFDRSLRILDPADELAFLALECERFGAPEVGPLVFETYATVTGDRPPARLVDFYRAFRATLWARLAIWRTQELPPDRWSPWIARASQYLTLAAGYGARLR